MTEGPLSVKWFGARGDGQSQNDDYPAIQATLDAVPDVGGTVLPPPGNYVSSRGFIVKTHGTTITGMRSAYSYGDNLWAAQVQFVGGVTGFDFCMGLPTSEDPNSNYYKQLRIYCKISQLAINGGNILQTGIRMASANLIEEVSVFGCSGAGILLDNFTDQVHINKCCASSNHIGLYSNGRSTTIWSCKQSNWRQNGVGVRIEGGAVVQMENCVIESNGSYGMDIYASANTGFLHHLSLKSLWFENNCANSVDRYAPFIHSETNPDSYLPTHIRFEQCLFNASSDAQSCIHVQRAQLVTYDECAFYCYNPDRDIVLDAAAIDRLFRNCIGLPVDIATKGTNTIVNERRTGAAPPVSGSFSLGEIVWNSAPALGGEVGWVCILAGAPGAFKPFGTIAT